MKTRCCIVYLNSQLSNRSFFRVANNLMAANSNLALILGHIFIRLMLILNNLIKYVQADIPTLKRLIFLCHMVASFIHIIFFTYICHGLMEESGNVGLATYSGWWTTLPMNETGRMLRKDIRIIMMKSMRPCYLSAGGFFPMSLETSTAVCNLF